TNADIANPNRPFTLSAIQIKVAKITTWTNPLPYSPLYMAPTPGMNPRIAASPGLGRPVDGLAPGGTAAGPGGGIAPLKCEARHSSQYTARRTSREQLFH